MLVSPMMRRPGHFIMQKNDKGRSPSKFNLSSKPPTTYQDGKKSPNSSLHMLIL